VNLENIVTWLKALAPELSDCIAAGGIDGSKEKFVGVYNDNKTKGSSRICLGGAENVRYDYKNVTVLIHWTNNAYLAEKKAQGVFDLIYGSCGFLMGDVSIVSVDPGRGPVSVGKDEYGIFEYVINMEICYERI
jgi:hypothetical protein